MPRGPNTWRALNPEYDYTLALDDEIEDDVAAYAAAHGVPELPRQGGRIESASLLPMLPFEREAHAVPRLRRR